MEKNMLCVQPSTNCSEAGVVKTLDEFNDQRWESHNARLDADKPHPNGIACPECNSELWDSNPMLTLTSNPCKKNIHCPDCGYKGYRLA